MCSFCACSSTAVSQVPKVGMPACELPHATRNSIDGSTRRIALAVSAASRPYSIGTPLVSELPRPVHFVAQAPEFDTVGLALPVRDAKVGILGSGREVRVLQQADCFGDAAGAKVDGEHGLRPRCGRSSA